MASEQQLEIWFLCRHVYADQEVGVLIENPMEQSGNPRWSVRFESPDFGTKEQRIGLYRKSLAAGLVRVFDRPNYNDSNFFVETSFDDIRHPKFRFARSVITKAGLMNGRGNLILIGRGGAIIHTSKFPDLTRSYSR